jgi:hypothetical protein
MGVRGTMSVSPVGFIEVKEGTARFRPIFDLDTVLKLLMAGGLIALGVVSLFGRGTAMRVEKSRGSLVNVVFKPHTTIIARGGQTRKPRQAFQPRFRLRRKKMRVGQARLFRSRRT